MSAEADRAFLASDAFRAWEKRMQAANESVVVFGPYLDSLLDRLLKTCPLDVDAITVVTDLSPASGAVDYRAQLIEVHALLQRGIKVCSLSRLHAKVLLCDWQTVTIGSQNFTDYARNSYETTAVPAEDLRESKFMSTLREWFDAAVPVDLSFVELLLAGLDSDMNAARGAQAALATSYEQLWDKYQREQAAGLTPIGARLGAAIRSAQERLARPSVRARLVEVGDEYRSYNTFSADPRSSLVEWPTQFPGQAATSRSLTRYFNYPMILNPSGRMGYARVVGTRISYVDNGVNRTLESLAGMKYRMHVQFPDDNLDAANLYATLRSEDRESTAAIKLLVQFDIGNAVLVGHEIIEDGVFRNYVPESGWHASSPEEVAASFANLEEFHQLMHAAFDSFKYEDPLLYLPNADKFFPPGELLVTLVEYAEQPVLVVSQET
jgi:PLD-like domain